MPEGLPSLVRRAWANHSDDAERALILYRDEYCGGRLPPRVPGLDTAIRMAIRLENGRTIEEAAAREYLYRWKLELRQDRLGYKPWSFGAPHILGQ